MKVYGEHRRMMQSDFVRYFDYFTAIISARPTKNPVFKLGVSMYLSENMNHFATVGFIYERTIKEKQGVLL
jgi:hypothetical protein